MNDDIDTKKAFAERYAELPPVLQRAIDSAEVEEHLRTLAKTHNLHLDQWQTLENEVMLTLFGFEATANLQKNLETEVGVPAEQARALADDISKIVFEPIRAQLEEQLDHPEQQRPASTDLEKLRMQEIAVAQSVAITASNVTAPAIQPATPPTPTSDGKAVRAQISGAYSGAASHERKTVEGDPYREQLT